MKLPDKKHGEKVLMRIWNGGWPLYTLEKFPISDELGIYLNDGRELKPGNWRYV